MVTSRPQDYSWLVFETSLHTAYLGIRGESGASPTAWQITETNGTVRLHHPVHEPNGVDVDFEANVRDDLPFERSQLALMAVGGLQAASNREEFEMYGTPAVLEIELRFDRVSHSQSPALDAAYACDAIEADYAAIRNLAMERIVRVFIVIPQRALTTQLGEAIRRRHQVSFHDTLLEVMRERPSPDTKPTTRYLPSLVAAPLAFVSRHHRTVDSRWKAVSATGEAVVRYIASIAVATELTGDRHQKLSQLVEIFESPTPPTVGRWVAIISRHPARVRELLPKTFETLWNKHGRPTEHGAFFFGDYVADRNFYTHTGILSDPQCLDLLQRLKPHLDVLIPSLSDDTQASPPVVRSDLEFGDGHMFDYTLTELTGSKIVLPTNRVVSPTRLEPNKVYLQRSTTEYIDLDPLIVCETCRQCGLEEGFFLSKLNRAQPEWLSLRGHRYPGRSTNRRRRSEV